MRQGRVFRPSVDIYLNYWLVMRRHEEVPAGDVFQVFRDHARDYTNTEGLV